MENNNKESYALLEMDDSDSPSDTTEIIIAPQKKKRLTKHRHHHRASNSQSTKYQKPVCGGRTVSMTLALVLLFCWFLTLTWLAIILNAQIQRLDNKIQTVVAGNQGVPDALQKCHSLSKELQQNQSALFLRLSELSSQFANFSNQVASISNGLSRVEQRFKTSPELINVPHDIETLTSNVASFGSQLKDLLSTVAQLKDANTHLTETTHVLDLNITTLKEKVSELSTLSPDKLVPSVDTEVLKSSINSVQANLSLINQTLSSKLQWALEDQAKDHKAIVVLQDKSENVSARVTTLQNEQNECTAKTSSIKSDIDRLNSQVTVINAHWKELLNQTNELSKSYSQLQSNSSLLQLSVQEMKQSLHSTDSSTQSNSSQTNVMSP